MRLTGSIAVCLLVGACALGSGERPPEGFVPVAGFAPPTVSSTSTSTVPVGTTTTTVPSTVVAEPWTSLGGPVTTAGATDEVAAARASGANEAGAIMVLEYHLIEDPEARWSRTPANLRSDIERLIAAGYYPITTRDLALGHIDVPAGKTPVVLTFDDSSIGQCRYGADGRVDRDSACGILLTAAEEHPDDWSPAASFYVLLDVDVPERILFGQPDLVEQKLRDMVSWGMEIGSHTISHFRLDLGSRQDIRWQLAVPETYIESIIPDYEVDTLAVPLGGYPADDSLLVSGRWEGDRYDHIAVLEVAGGPASSPHTAPFDPMHIPRIQVVQADFDYWLAYFEAHPEERYVSDGNPETVAVPDWIDFDPAARLEGLRVVRYGR